MKVFFYALLLELALIVAAVPPFDPAGAKNVGNGQGQQFIGGQCLSDADCGSGCCANPTGICSGPDASTQAGKTGCGFPVAGILAANESSATSAIQSSATSAIESSATNATESSATSATASQAVATSSFKGGPPFDPAGEKNVGNGQGQQFIGGQCLSTADCASGCCAGPSGICSGPDASTLAGKTGCGFVSNKRLLRA